MTNNPISDAASCRDGNFRRGGQSVLWRAPANAVPIILRKGDEIVKGMAVDFDIGTDAKSGKTRATRVDVV